MGFAEPVIGRRFAPTRWFNPPYAVGRFGRWRARPADDSAVARPQRTGNLKTGTQAPRGNAMLGLMQD